MCQACDDKDHAIYVKDKQIRRLERKIQYKPTITTVISLITVVGFMGSVLLFSFSTYFDHKNTVVMAQDTRILTEKNRDDIKEVKYETAKELALLNQSMTRVLKILEGK